MEVEVSPRLRRKMLYGGIEGSRRRHNERQQCRIERVNVLEMNNICVFSEQYSQSVANPYDAHNNEEDEQMRVGKKRYELRNRVVGVNLRQHVFFPYPSHF